uniref:Pre-mRNA-splicing factor ISY1 homolog n=1 Tax=Sinocyclocheilus grahami TaxID=75366 RepID=A0A672PZF0_SINGR
MNYCCLYFQARNAEKAMTALARFRQAQLEEGRIKERRPFLASECNELPKAEKWRRQIISEISKKVAQIQNAGLGEFKIRDLNDEINKLLREKGHWEVRIKELGGPDYRRVGPKMLDHEGKEVPGNRGYKYFGAAKDLPGVRELFEKEPVAPPRKTRAELMKDIDADYYGYRDEDDGALVPLEQEYEKQGGASSRSGGRGETDNTHSFGSVRLDGKGSQSFISHVPVPSQKEVCFSSVHFKPQKKKKSFILIKYRNLLALMSFQTHMTSMKHKRGICEAQQYGVLCVH